MEELEEMAHKLHGFNIGRRRSTVAEVKRDDDDDMDSPSARHRS